jgi:hypothetical protein
MPYRIYLTRKTGAVETGVEIHRDPLPQPGDVIDVDVLKGGRVQARVGSQHTDRSKVAGATVVVEVQAAEI